MPIQLPPRQAYELLATSPHPGKLDIERSTVITVYAWTGATIEVYAAGTLVHSQTVAVPEGPPGISIRDFLTSLGLTKT
jgi:hypothetical protein